MGYLALLQSPNNSAFYRMCLCKLCNMISRQPFKKWTGTFPNSHVSPLLTYNSAHCHLQRFSDDSAAVEYITDECGDEYRMMIQDFAQCCQYQYKWTWRLFRCTDIWMCTKHQVRLENLHHCPVQKSTESTIPAEDTQILWSGQAIPQTVLWLCGGINNLLCSGLLVKWHHRTRQKETWKAGKEGQMCPGAQTQQNKGERWWSICLAITKHLPPPTGRPEQHLHHLWCVKNHNSWSFDCTSQSPSLFLAYLNNTYNFRLIYLSRPPSIYSSSLSIVFFFQEAAVAGGIMFFLLCFYPLVHLSHSHLRHIS